MRKPATILLTVLAAAQLQAQGGSAAAGVTLRPLGPVVATSPQEFCGNVWVRQLRN
jgi:hypothetical protein